MAPTAAPRRRSWPASQPRPRPEARSSNIQVVTRRAANEQIPTTPRTRIHQEAAAEVAARLVRRTRGASAPETSRRSRTRLADAIACKLSDGPPGVPSRSICRLGDDLPRVLTCVHTDQASSPRTSDRSHSSPSTSPRSRMITATTAAKPTSPSSRNGRRTAKSSRGRYRCRHDHRRREGRGAALLVRPGAAKASTRAFAEIRLKRPLGEGSPAVIEARGKTQPSTMSSRPTPPTTSSIATSASPPTPDRPTSAEGASSTNVGDSSTSSSPKSGTGASLPPVV